MNLHFANNLTGEERQALMAIKNNNELMADKGGAIMVMDKRDDMKEAERLLSDHSMY